MTRPRTVRVERLLGRRVVDPEGRSVGRIEEIRVARHGHEWQVEEYYLGVYGLLRRLAVWGFGRALLGAFRRTRPQRIPWDELDLGDPERPRLRHPIRAGARRAV